MSELILSCDDGCLSDIRVAELAEKYDLQCTFYWPVEWKSLAYDKGYEPLTFRQAQEIAKKHEVGCHGYTHRYLTRISGEEARIEILDCKLAMEKMFGKTIEKFCFPRGYSSEEITAFVLGAGFYGYRMTRGNDTEGYKLVHVHPNSGANDNKRWQDCITDKTHLWFHSKDLDEFSLWDELEEVLRENHTA